MLFQSRQLGVCVIARRTYDAFFTAGQIALARTTAEFLGIACANAELQAQRLAQLRVERELEIAAQIQQSLVPKEFPVRPDWRIHGLCVNAQEAGGDFFDVPEVPGGVLLVIADVMGKGVSAALLAVVLRTAVRAHAPLAANPGELLGRPHAPGRTMSLMNSTPASTILIVDDESHMRRLLQFALAKTGMQLVLAANGREALAQAQTRIIDLLVIDFMMPDLDGFATLRELRRDPRYAKLPVIMLTSRGQAELREIAEDVGVDVFLTKPFSPIELTRHVRRLLGAK